MTTIPITTDLSGVSTKAILNEAARRCPNAADLLDTLRIIECMNNDAEEIEVLSERLEHEASDAAATYLAEVSEQIPMPAPQSSPIYPVL